MQHAYRRRLLVLFRDLKIELSGCTNTQATELSNRRHMARGKKEEEEEGWYGCGKTGKQEINGRSPFVVLRKHWISVRPLENRPKQHVLLYLWRRHLRLLQQVHLHCCFIDTTSPCVRYRYSLLARPWSEFCSGDLLKTDLFFSSGHLDKTNPIWLQNKEMVAAFVDTVRGTVVRCGIFTNTEGERCYRDTNMTRSLAGDPLGLLAPVSANPQIASGLEKGAFHIGLKLICQSSEDSQSSTSTRLR